MIPASGGPLNPRRALFLAVLCVVIVVLASSTAVNATRTAASLAHAAAPLSHGNNPPPNLKTRAVVLIVLDGFRWQEVFAGPEHDLMDARHGGAQDVAQLRKDFWRDTPGEGRQALLPFLGPSSRSKARFTAINTKATSRRSPTASSFPIPVTTRWPPAIPIRRSIAT